ncbi:MAG: hypothetical protein E6J74_24345 [Deltaproteobacteria bacterium]|nr:MAG: hypothetical protein E6J74_24345 [Deltaproteobacteria bacterium]
MLVPLAQELRAEGLEQVLPMVLEGDPAGKIIDLANTTPNSLIAMSTRQIRYRALDAEQRRKKIVQHSRHPRASHQGDLKRTLRFR